MKSKQSPSKPILIPPKVSNPQVSPITAATPRHQHNQLKEWSQSKLDERLFLTSLVQPTSDLLVASPAPRPLASRNNSESSSRSSRKENYPPPPSISAPTSPIKPPTAKRQRTDDPGIIAEFQAKAANSSTVSNDKDLVRVVEEGVRLIHQVDLLSRTDLTRLQLNLSKLLAAVCEKFKR